MQVMSESKKEPTEDFEVFGDTWIYCNQHLRPHLTNWCTVPVNDKVGLGIPNAFGGDIAAVVKCQHMGLKIIK